MVEGSQIDWAAHANDAVSAMSEMEDLAKAFETVIEFAKQDKHTQVVLTADHSTGGFSIGRDGDYNFTQRQLKQRSAHQNSWHRRSWMVLQLKVF